MSSLENTPQFCKRGHTKRGLGRVVLSEKGGAACRRARGGEGVDPEGPRLMGLPVEGPWAKGGAVRRGAVSYTYALNALLIMCIVINAKDQCV